LNARLRASLASGLPAFTRFVPFLAWGTGLLVLALPAHGILAVRDFAVFYYALFLPVGYAAASGGRSLVRQVAVATAGCLVIVGHSLLIAATGGGESLNY